MKVERERLERVIQRAANTQERDRLQQQLDRLRAQDAADRAKYDTEARALGG